MSSGGFRSFIFRLHKWFGLNAAIVLALIFGSGIVLLASEELDALMHPALWASAPAEGEAASFGTVYESVHSAYPASTIYVIQRQPKPWLADRSYMTTPWGEKLVVWTDPRTAKIVEITKDRNFRAIATELHDRLLVPGRKGGRLGFLAVTAMSFVLLYSLISGLITYRRFWKGFFRKPPKDLGARGYQGGLHRLLGLWATVFLLIISLTGIYFFANGLGINGYVPRPAQAQERPQIRPDGFGGPLIDQDAARAIAALPGFAPTTLVLPAHRRAGMLFTGLGAGTSLFDGGNVVSIDPLTGETLGVIRPADARGVARIKAMVNVLHFGQWGGPWSRILWGVFGVASLWLLLSGVRTYIARAKHFPDARARGGGLRRFFRGMGLLGWANLGLLGAVVAFGLLQFGNLRPKWVPVAPAPGSAATIHLSVRGKLRADKPLQLAVSLDEGVKGSAEIRASGAEPISRLTANGEGTRMAFTTIARPENNTITVTVNDPGGTKEQAVFNLGRAIW